MEVVEPKMAPRRGSHARQSHRRAIFRCHRSLMLKGCFIYYIAIR